MKYSVLAIAVLLIAAALIAGCTQQQTASPQTTVTASPDVVKVGVIASLTGPASNVGTNMWQSAQVAADKINADGGVTLKDGKKAQIKLIVGDDESTQAGGQKAQGQPGRPQEGGVFGQGGQVLAKGQHELPGDDREAVDVFDVEGKRAERQGA